MGKKKKVSVQEHARPAIHNWHNLIWGYGDIILHVSADGMVRDPNGTIRTVEDTALRLPEMIRRADNPVLAIMASADTSMSIVRPLLAVAEEMGHHRAVFALNHGSPLALLSDQHGKRDSSP